MDKEIRFMPLDEVAKEKIIKNASLNDGDREYLCEVLDSFFGTEGAAVYLYSSFLLVRFESDGEHSFVYPIPLSDGLEPTDALIALADYARRELIPLVLTDLPREDISLVTRLFPYVDACCYEDDEDSFFVRIHNECSRLSEVPTFDFEGGMLSEITERDKDKYLALATDKAVNEYWGYDLKEDNAKPTGEYLVSVVEREFSLGVALSLAIRVGGEFVGEAVLYDFDFRGGCEGAIRLLPSAQGKGIGTKAFQAVIGLAKEIGAKTLLARVKKENAPSIAMMERLMTRVSENAGTVCYKRVL